MVYTKLLVLIIAFTASSQHFNEKGISSYKKQTTAINAIVIKRVILIELDAELASSTTLQKNIFAKDEESINQEVQKGQVKGRVSIASSLSRSS